MIWEICSNLYIAFQELIGSFYLLNKYENECEDGETSVWPRFLEAKVKV